MFFRFFFVPCISCGVRRSTACLPIMARHLSIILASCLVLSCVQYSLHKVHQRYGNTKVLVFQGLTPFTEVEIRLVKTKHKDLFAEAVCLLCLLMPTSANNFHTAHRITLFQKPSSKSLCDLQHLGGVRLSPGVGRLISHCDLQHLGGVPVMA